MKLLTEDVQGADIFQFGTWLKELSFLNTLSWTRKSWRSLAEPFHVGKCGHGMLDAEGEGAGAGAGAGVVVVVLSEEKWARSCEC